MYYTTKHFYYWVRGGDKKLYCRPIHKNTYWEHSKADVKTILLTAWPLWVQRGDRLLDNTGMEWKVMRFPSGGLELVHDTGDKEIVKKLPPDSITSWTLIESGKNS
jgi:hypothetical protein